MPHDHSDMIVQLRETLTQQRYNRVVVHNYCRNADAFLSYLAEREIAVEAVTPTEVSNYLRFAVRQFRKRHSRAPGRRWVSIPRAGIHALLKLTLKRWPPEPVTSDAGELFWDGFAVNTRHGCERNAGWRWRQLTALCGKPSIF